MSVNAKISEMPTYRMPRSVRAFDVINAAYAAATGKGELFRLQGVDYARNRIGEDLTLVPGEASHGVIAPVRPMPIEAYQRALCDTRTQWIVEEPDGS